MSVLSEAPAIPGDRMLSPREVAEVLGVSRDYVYALVNSGDLPSRKIGANRRVWMSALRSWVDAQ
jgi:excisionase family DNA binding protein